MTTAMLDESSRIPDNFMKRVIRCQYKHGYAPRSIATIHRVPIVEVAKAVQGMPEPATSKPMRWKEKPPYSTFWTAFFWNEDYLIRKNLYLKEILEC